MTVDTSTTAITARCQHLDHCAHDGKSEDAARMMAILAERDALRDQLAAARGEANGLRGALRQIFARSSQARPAHYEATILKIEGISEDAIKSSQSNVQKMHIAAPAPREVSVQEAAQVLLNGDTGVSDALNSAGWEFTKAWSDIVQENLSATAFNHCKPLLRRVLDHYLRALAQEGQDDE